MSFWTKSTGEQATGNVADNDFSALPEGAYKCIISKAEVKQYQGDYYINMRFDVVEGTFAKRIVFGRLNCWHSEDKKRDRAIELLMKAYSVTNTKVPDDEPTDTDLVKLCDKPLMVKFGNFTPEGKTEAMNFIQNFEAISKTVTPRTPKNVPAAAKPAQVAEPSLDGDVTDDIPF